MFSNIFTIRGVMSRYNSNKPHKCPGCNRTWDWGRSRTLLAPKYRLLYGWVHCPQCETKFTRTMVPIKQLAFEGSYLKGV